MQCEHICDTFVYECIVGCNHETTCMRDCWIEHDRCAINCPCNAKCPDGCPTPHEGHSCQTWFCQGYIMGCAAQNDPDRTRCEQTSAESCKAAGCCWVPYEYNDDKTPWCHKPKKIPIS